MVQKIMRRAEVERVTGLKRATIYEKMAVGDFPKPIQLTGKAVGWLEAEVAAWQEARIAARDSKAA